MAVRQPRDLVQVRGNGQAMTSRNEIRRQMRRQRRALPAAERERRARSLAHQLRRTALFRRSRHVAGYIANDGEMDPGYAAGELARRGGRYYLPILSPAFHNRLWFAPYRIGTVLTRNQFGIPEPAVGWGGTRVPWGLDLILVPLVAFDADGNRLGMGGGFYDRTLAYLERRRHWHKPRLLGIAYEFQRVERLPVQPWDIPLDGIVTETGVYECGKGGRPL